MQTIRPQQLVQLLTALISAKLPVLITGAPGVGKTALVQQACKAANAKLITTHPVVSDPTDYKGLPSISADGKSAKWLPFGDLEQIIKAKQKTVFFLDDLGQAPASVQAALMQLLLARHVNEHKVSDHVTFIAATNRREDRAGVQGLLEPVKSRFNTIVELQTMIDDWSAWAFDAQLPPELVAFLNWKPNYLHAFKPSAEMVNSPCPRTWHKVGEMMQAGIPETCELAAYQGAVGEGPAAEMLAFVRMMRNLPSLDAVLLDPHQAVIPTEPDVKYAMAVGLAQKVKLESFANLCTYLDRMTKAGYGEHAALCLLSTARRQDVNFAHTPAFIKLASQSKLAKLILGS